MIDKIKGWISKIPIIGGLIACNGYDHWSAITEFSINFFCSTTPIWLGSIFMRILKEQFFVSLGNSVNGGELFMYSTAVLGSVIFIASTESRSGRAFPARGWHVLLVILIIIVCAGAFGLLRGVNSVMPVDRKFVLELSLFMYAVSLFLYYLALVYNNSLQRAIPLETQEENYVDEVRKHRT